MIRDFSLLLVNEKPKSSFYQLKVLFCGYSFLFKTILLPCFNQMFL